MKFSKCILIALIGLVCSANLLNAASIPAAEADESTTVAPAPAKEVAEIKEEETPATTEAATEAPKATEELKAEEPKVEAPKVEAPKAEEPKAVEQEPEVEKEEPKAEEKKAEKKPEVKAEKKAEAKPAAAAAAAAQQPAKKHGALRKLLSNVGSKLGLTGRKAIPAQ